MITTTNVDSLTEKAPKVRRPDKGRMITTHDLDEKGKLSDAARKRIAGKSNER